MKMEFLFSEIKDWRMDDENVCLGRVVGCPLRCPNNSSRGH